MRRGGDDELLAISPPPEFQDNPSVPPPVLFRDLSPAGTSNASNNNNNNATTTESRKSSIILSQAVQNCIREFADKVSYNILNEAMIIATLIPSAGVSNDVRSQASNSSFSISSGASYSSDSISTVTSWEYYVEKSSSVSDLPSSSFWRAGEGGSDIRRRSNYYYCRQFGGGGKISEQKGSCGLKKSISDAFPHNSCTGMNSGGEEEREDKQKKKKKKPEVEAFSSLKPRNNSQFVVRKRNYLDKVSASAGATGGSEERLHNDFKERGDDRGGTSVDSNDDVDVCYNVPYRCDIYSLPVDSIQNNNNNSNSKVREKASSSRRNSHTRRGKKSNAENREPTGGSMVFCEHQQQQESLRARSARRKDRTGSRLCHNAFQSYDQAGDNDDEDDGGGGESLRNVAGRLSEQNNNENNNAVLSSSSEGKVLRMNKKRRSLSVEDSSKSSLIQRKLSQCPENESQLTEFDGSKGKKNFGHTLLNLFKRSRPKSKTVQLPNNNDYKNDSDRQVVLVSRALPPPPTAPTLEPLEAENQSPIEPKDFSASIAKVKDCGWYWGPLASDEAEDLLRGEPDGSFIVRDSSDVHYIFSLTFKLNGLVRHVRIEHDQGNFSFGPLTRFKAATIVEFVEKAVAHSRSGRYLFFLHRRPVLGPMQVQLLHPYSRFRHPRSLQHMCRFVILKFVRRDLLNTLPLPKPLQDYLNTPTNYYFEQQEVNQK